MNLSGFHYLLTFSKLTLRHIVIRNKINRAKEYSEENEEKENDTEIEKNAHKLILTQQHKYSRRTRRRKKNRGK